LGRRAFGYAVRRNLDEQKRKTLEYVFDPDTGPFKSSDVRAWFEKEFPQTEDNEDFTPIRNLLKASTISEADSRARLDIELIGQSRVALDSLITVFPVIGFVDWWRKKRQRYARYVGVEFLLFDNIARARIDDGVRHPEYLAGEARTRPRDWCAGLLYAVARRRFALNDAAWPSSWAT
jgi:hypothetical protein